MKRPSDETVLLMVLAGAVLALSLGAALIFAPAGLLMFGALALALSLIGLRGGR